MGLYPADCNKCGTPFNWFSGNPNSQFCEKCINAKMEPNMSHQPQNHLESIISLQAEVIALLKAEIERLKNSTQVFNNPPIIPNTQHLNPVLYTQHLNPVPYIQQPINPLQPPYIVTCGDNQVSVGNTYFTTTTETVSDPATGCTSVSVSKNNEA